jgi:hypothetical protein
MRGQWIEAFLPQRGRVELRFARRRWESTLCEGAPILGNIETDPPFPLIDRFLDSL